MTRALLIVALLLGFAAVAAIVGLWPRDYLAVVDAYERTDDPRQLVILASVGIGDVIGHVHARGV